VAYGVNPILDNLRLSDQYEPMGKWLSHSRPWLRHLPLLAALAVVISVKNSDDDFEPRKDLNDGTSMTDLDQPAGGLPV
jgi:hypothetical protein